MVELVHVVFVDADSGTAFAETDIPPDKLPESFADPTTLQLGEEQWSVVRAEPVTAEEFTRTGELRLEMRLVVMMDPQQIHFSLPTISDELPACEPVDAPDALVLGEDDWRQVELVADACATEIAACIAQIERIYGEHQKDSGVFDAIHVRSELPEPLRGVVLSLEALRTALPGAGGNDGVGLPGNGRIVDGFGFRLTSGIQAYGLAPSGLVRVLGLALPESTDDPEADAAALAALMATHRLVLVDWCGAEVVPAEKDALLAYLRDD